VINKGGSDRREMQYAWRYEKYIHIFCIKIDTKEITWEAEAWMGG
jgi:hypothetical protein